MRIYETIYICPPNLEEDSMEEFSDLIREIIYDNGGKIIKQENWGKRRLAYEIEHHSDGVYFYFLYGGNGECVSALERRLKISERCIRFLTVRLDKELKGKKHKIFTKEELRLALQMDGQRKEPSRPAKAKDDSVDEAAPAEETAAEVADEVTAEPVEEPVVEASVEEAPVEEPAAEEVQDKEE